MQNRADLGIVRRLGGGRGTAVELAREPSGRTCVVKRARDPGDIVTQAQLGAEARALAAIRHEGVVELVAVVDEPDGTIALVLEHVEGPTLAAVLAQHGPAPWAWVVELMAAIARALAAVHAAGHVHGDVSPANVICPGFVGYAGPPSIKLIDFGLAEPLDSGPAGGRPLMGTVGYLAPERARGQAGDARSDLYAIGAIAFELLTARLPGAGSSPRLAEANPAALVPVALERVVVALLAPTPERRPADAAALVAELAGLAEPDPRASRRDAAADVQLTALANRVREAWLVGVLDASTRGLTLIPQARIVRGSEREPPRRLDPHASLIREADRVGLRLQIVGPAGYGKTTQLLKLARELLDRHRQRRSLPVPVVFSLSEWRATDASLAAFMTAQLRTKYGIPTTHAAAFVEHRRIVPLLDALDEAPADTRGAAVAAITAYLDGRDRPPLVLTYRDSLPQLQAQLVFPATVELCALDPQQAARFLGGEWRRLKLLLEQDGELDQLSHTPMMLQLMRLLVREEGFAGRSSTDEDPVPWLFRRYLETVFASPRGRDVDPDRLLASVAGLAQTLGRAHKSLLVLEELQPSALEATRSRVAYLLGSRLLVAGLLCATVIPALVSSPLDNGGFAATRAFSIHLVAATAVIAGLGFALWTRAPARWRGSVAATLAYATALGGLIGACLLPYQHPIVGVFAVEGAWICAAVLGLSRRARSFPDDDIAAVESLRWDAAGITRRSWALLGLAAATSFAAIAVVDSVRAGAQVAAFVGAIGTAALASRHARVEAKITPNLGIHRSIRSASVAAALGFAVTALILGGSYGAGYAGKGGLFIATLCGLWFGGVDAIQHYLLRGLLLVERALPVRLRTFEQAVDLGFLRRVGNGWMFAHASLREYLARGAGRR